MRNALLILCVIGTLAACAPAQPTMTDVQNTAIAIVQTSIALTQTALPTSTPPPPTLTPTLTPTAFSTPSLVPTLALPIFTPDAIQLERWREYQDELAKTHLAEAYGTTYGALCEWDILVVRLKSNLT